jgi:hypothetical protein
VNYAVIIAKGAEDAKLQILNFLTEV